MMIFDVLTLFPGLFESPLKESILGRAIGAGLVDVRLTNIRDFTTDTHRTTDDSPYGGGCGMVMKPEPVVAAIEAVLAEAAAEAEAAGEVEPAVAQEAEEEAGCGCCGDDDGCSPSRPLVILATPQGEPFDQSMAAALAGVGRMVIVCGRYEGVDERIRDYVDLEVSVGDYVLTGGEIPALCIIDAVARLVPGVLGHPDSSVDESFSSGLLEYPQYTRPEEFRGERVPEVLLSGNHEMIRLWRRAESLKRTLEYRPDLLADAELTDEDMEILETLQAAAAAEEDAQD